MKKTILIFCISVSIVACKTDKQTPDKGEPTTPKIVEKKETPKPSVPAPKNLQGYFLECSSPLIGLLNHERVELLEKGKYCMHYNLKDCYTVKKDSLQLILERPRDRYIGYFRLLKLQNTNENVLFAYHDESPDLPMVEIWKWENDALVDKTNTYLPTPAINEFYAPNTKLPEADKMPSNIMFGSRWSPTQANKVVLVNDAAKFNVLRGIPQIEVAYQWNGTSFERVK